MTRFAVSDAPRVGQQAALGNDLLAFLDSLEISAATLAGFDWGGRAACVVAALQPQRVHGLVTCGGYNLQNSASRSEPAPPAVEQRHWYWFYLTSERGASALSRDRFRLCRFFWESWSPTWSFEGSTYERTARSFDNPDFVDIVLHSYRYRVAAAEGSREYEEMEGRLAAEPEIVVPTIVLSGAEDGVDPPPQPDEVTGWFADLRRLQVLDGVGHNVPGEAPAEVSQAVLDLAEKR